MAAFTVGVDTPLKTKTKSKGSVPEPKAVSPSRRSIELVLDATKILMKKFTDPIYIYGNEQLSLVGILRNMISEYNNIYNLRVLLKNSTDKKVIKDTYVNLRKKSATNLYNYVSELINFIKSAKTNTSIFSSRCNAVKFINEFIKKKVMSLESIQKSAYSRMLDPHDDDKNVTISTEYLKTFVTEIISIQDIYTKNCYSKSQIQKFEQYNNPNIKEATINMKNFEKTVEKIKSLTFTKKIPLSTSVE